MAGTTVRKEEEERQQISATTYDELIGKLYDFYADHKRDFAISDLYEVWMEKRGKQALDGKIDIKTVKRDDEHWLKYYAGDKLVSIPVKR